MNTYGELEHLFSAKPQAGALWDGQYKIPWDDPDFSRRMLAEHLSQDHDLASRKLPAIRAQVNWIHENLQKSRPGRLLDLGCGPGLYSREFAALGYQCRGLDFSSASIQHARQINQGRAEFELADLRTADFGCSYDLAVMIYGEFNVFSPPEIRDLLTRVHRALAPGGRALFEVQTFETVREMGQGPATWFKSEAGLFSDRPHVCLTENHWFEEEKTAVQQFFVIDAQSGRVAAYRSTTRAWTREEGLKMLEEAGFHDPKVQPDWPSQNPGLALWSALGS